MWFANCLYILVILCVSMPGIGQVKDSVIDKQTSKKSIGLDLDLGFTRTMLDNYPLPLYLRLRNTNRSSYTEKSILFYFRKIDDIDIKDVDDIQVNGFADYKEYNIELQYALGTNVAGTINRGINFSAYASSFYEQFKVTPPPSSIVLPVESLKLGLGLGAQAEYMYAFNSTVSLHVGITYRLASLFYEKKQRFGDGLTEALRIEQGIKPSLTEGSPNSIIGFYIQM